MEPLRKPFQGVWNIIRFNWHFYVLAIGAVGSLLLLGNFLNENFRNYMVIISGLIVATTIVSLLVSFYVYDLSNLYQLQWLGKEELNSNPIILNIHAGFDETSTLLQKKFPKSELLVFDFYDPKVHTEVSIKRARKAYPPFPNTQPVKTSTLLLRDNFIDKIFVILSAHEIRNEEERIIFFKELKRIIKQNGQIVVVEHLRDLPNFLAYNIGFFHFLSKPTWDKTFKYAALDIQKAFKITPFITTFILKENGATS